MLQWISQQGRSLGLLAAALALLFLLVRPGCGPSAATRLPGQTPSTEASLAKAAPHEIRTAHVRVRRQPFADEHAGTETGAFVVDAPEVSLRPVTLVPLLEQAGRPVVVLETEARVSRVANKQTLLLTFSALDGQVRISMSAELSRDDAWSTWQVTAQNQTKEDIQGLRVGLAVHWPGRPAFAPGVGPVRGPIQAAAPFVAREQLGASYALVDADGELDFEGRADHVGHLGVATLSQSITLTAGAVHSEQRVLLIDPGRLASVGRDAWAFLETPLGTLSGTLPSMPSWARVEAYDARGRIMLRTTVDPTGAWQLSLPPGQYKLRLITPGGRDDKAAVVRDDQDETVDLLTPEPGRLQFETVDAAGEPLPARWQIIGVPPTADPTLAEGPLNEGNVVFTLSGAGAVELPQGVYRVRASHGPEFSLFEQQLRITSKAGAVVRAVLGRLVDSSGFAACDFHLHAAPSFDSEVTLEQRVIALLAEGIAFAVPTDHNVVTDYAPTLEALEERRLSTTSGIEVTTTTWGHFNVFPYAAERPGAARLKLAPVELFQALRASAEGSVIQVNHPLMGDIGYFTRAELDTSTAEAKKAGFSLAFDTIEVFNGFDLARPDVIHRTLEAWFDLLNLGYRFTAIGSSDSHRLTVQWVGYPRTYVRTKLPTAPRIDPADIVSGLQNGAAIVTNGPFLRVTVEGGELGEQVSAREGRVAVRIVVQAPPWMAVDRVTVFSNGESIHQTPIGVSSTNPRADLSLDLSLARDAWIVVLVQGDRSMDVLLPKAKAAPFAFTNPIYVDVDGDGRFSAPLAGSSKGQKAAAGKSAPHAHH